MISVLVVDDHEQVLRATTRALERHGLICQTARNLTEAVARAREEPPCAVLLDLSLGDESGFDLHAALRAAGETDPAIIFVTSRRDQFFHTLPVLGPSDDWIIKPWDPAELIARVHLALRRTQRSAEGSARAPAAYAPVRPRLTSFTRARRHSLQRLGWPGGHSKSHSPIGVKPTFRQIAFDAGLSVFGNAGGVRFRRSVRARSMFSRVAAVAEPATLVRCKDRPARVVHARIAPSSSPEHDRADLRAGVVADREDARRVGGRGGDVALMTFLTCSSIQGRRDAP